MNRQLNKTVQLSKTIQSNELNLSTIEFVKSLGKNYVYYIFDIDTMLDNSINKMIDNDISNKNIKLSNLNFLKRLLSEIRDVKIYLVSSKYNLFALREFEKNLFERGFSNMDKKQVKIIQQKGNKDEIVRNIPDFDNMNYKNTIYFDFDEEYRRICEIGDKCIFINIPNELKDNPFDSKNIINYKKLIDNEILKKSNTRELSHQSSIAKTSLGLRPLVGKISAQPSFAKFSQQSIGKLSPQQSFAKYSPQPPVGKLPSRLPTSIFERKQSEPVTPYKSIENTQSQTIDNSPFQSIERIPSNPIEKIPSKSIEAELSKSINDVRLSQSNIRLSQSNNRLNIAEINDEMCKKTNIEFQNLDIINKFIMLMNKSSIRKKLDNNNGCIIKYKDSCLTIETLKNDNEPTAKPRNIINKIVDNSSIIEPLNRIFINKKYISQGQFGYTVLFNGNIIYKYFIDDVSYDNKLSETDCLLRILHAIRDNKLSTFNILIPYFVYSKNDPYNEKTYNSIMMEKLDKAAYEYLYDITDDNKNRYYVNFLLQTISSFWALVNIGIYKTDNHCENIMVKEIPVNKGSLYFYLYNRCVCIPNLGKLFILIDYGVCDDIDTYDENLVTLSFFKCIAELFWLTLINYCFFNPRFNYSNKKEEDKKKYEVAKYIFNEFYTVYEKIFGVYDELFETIWNEREVIQGAKSIKKCDIKTFLENIKNGKYINNIDQLNIILRASLQNMNIIDDLEYGGNVTLGKIKNVINDIITDIVKYSDDCIISTTISRIVPELPTHIDDNDIDGDIYENKMTISGTKEATDRIKDMYYYIGEYSQTGEINDRLLDLVDELDKDDLENDIINDNNLIYWLFFYGSGNDDWNNLFSNIMDKYVENGLLFEKLAENKTILEI
jgi:hypothetical protein